jgi:hypothetical protein
MGEFSLDIDTKMLGLLLQERSCASRTDFIHGEVEYLTVLDIDELGILTANLENRIHIGKIVGGAEQLTGDFIADRICMQISAGQITATPRSPDP